MTTIAVLVDPPREGLVFDRLAASSPLTESECADLYAAGVKDVCRAATESGGDLLVNYRADEALPERFQAGDAEAEVRAVVDEVDPEARFEVQVGETFAGRAGNTATHLLDREGVQSVAITTPEAAFLTRQQVDEAAMKLRRSEVVLGPSPGGRVYYASFREPVDFADAYAPPALGTLTDRAIDAGRAVDFLPQLPIIETGDDLADALVATRARQRADRIAPTHLADAFDGLDLVVEADGDGLTVSR
jgi:glycosyltransferase A (GT-A) superfamily protein (DUF2064 family)